MISVGSIFCFTGRVVLAVCCFNALTTVIAEFIWFIAAFNAFPLLQLAARDCKSLILSWSLCFERWMSDCDLPAGKISSKYVCGSRVLWCTWRLVSFFFIIIRWTCLQIVECKVASRHVQEHMCMQMLHVLPIIWH